MYAVWVHRRKVAHLGVAPREVLAHLGHQLAPIRTGSRVLEQLDQIDRLVGAARLSWRCEMVGNTLSQCSAA